MARASCTTSLTMTALDTVVASEGEDGDGPWLACLQSRDAMAHRGLAIRLTTSAATPRATVTLRRQHRAPHPAAVGSGADGKAAQAVGETAERSPRSGRDRVRGRMGSETDAPESLGRLSPA